MSGEIEVVAPGYAFDETADEVVTLAKLNQLVSAMVLKIMAGAISNRELADGTISADKLAEDLSAQMAIPAGAITTAKLATGALANSATGRAKMEDGFLSADATGLAKMAAGFLATNATGLALMEDGYLAASTAGRAKMANGFVTAAKMAALAGVGTMAQRLAFHAYLTANQTFATAVDEEVVVLDAEVFDSGGCFSVSTHKFTPTVAGLYLFIGQMMPTTTGLCRPAICKNALQSAFGNYGAMYAGSGVIVLLSMNGTTDYITLTMTTSAPGQVLVGGANMTFLQGMLVSNA